MILVSPNHTYGHYDPRKISLVAMERISGKAEVGKVVKVSDEYGLRRPALVKSIWGSAVMLDFNHPLAGKTLHFEVFVKDVRVTTTQEDI